MTILPLLVHDESIVETKAKVTITNLRSEACRMTTAMFCEATFLRGLEGFKSTFLKIS
ncbi:unnamed protein product [Hymenolepis diminuta]|uniref:Uncharacterized protein n=1 Tax=Hymenolepis diminuta TaxID=6216 RepID=A0A564YNB8_HYMDI|nr:unnamed protein product [Hymenolepis diminuta]